MPAHAVGGGTFTKNISYDGTRISAVTENIGGTTYQYDSMGRIVSINDGTPITFEYDTYGQFVKENNAVLDKIFVYGHNSNGNLVSITTYSYSTGALISEQSISYDATYPDRMTSCDNTSVSYNTMGCPTTHNGYTASWTYGKRSGLSKGSRAKGTYAYSYSYNAFGQRTSCSYTYTAPTLTVSPVVIGMLMSYIQVFRYDCNGRLIYEARTSEYYGEGSDEEKIVYLYDEYGVIGMVYTALGATNTYYFRRNLLGDVVGIYNTSGTQVGGYAYDAWGNCTITLDTNGIASRNPIRYRGYYYDADTGLYYLNSRYYSSLWRRFISPDDTAYLDPDTPNGLNLYTYCGNDPVNYADPSGCLAISIGFLVGSILIGAAVGAGSAGYTAFTQGETGWDLVWDIVGGGILGAAIGATMALGGAAGLGAVAGSAVAGINVSVGTALAVSIGGTAFASATKYSLNCAASQRQWSVEGYFVEAFQGAIQGAATFGLAYLGGKAGLFNKIGTFKTWDAFYTGFGGMNKLKMISYISNLMIGPTLSKLLLISAPGAVMRWVIDQFIPEL